MISFDVIETKDFDMMGSWKFTKNSIVIGSIRSYKGDLKINNEDYKREAAQLIVRNDNLIIETLDENALLFINKKKILANALLNKGDQLQIGHTLFEIKDYSYTNYEPSKKITENLKKIIRSNHPVYAIIKRLEQYLRN